MIVIFIGELESHSGRIYAIICLSRYENFMSSTLNDFNVFDASEEELIQVLLTLGSSTSSTLYISHTRTLQVVLMVMQEFTKSLGEGAGLSFSLALSLFSLLSLSISLSLVSIPCLSFCVRLRRQELYLHVAIVQCSLTNFTRRGEASGVCVEYPGLVPAQPLP